jgi:hypothetical protein
MLLCDLGGLTPRAGSINRWRGYVRLPQRAAGAAFRAVSGAAAGRAARPPGRAARNAAVAISITRAQARARLHVALAHGRARCVRSREKKYFFGTIFKLSVFAKHLKL